MATTAEAAYNLRTLARRVADGLGVKTASDMSLEQRQAYNRALVVEILKYPNAFTPEILNRAATINTDYGLRGHEFDGALDIVGDAVAPVVSGLQSIGLGAVAAANTARWLIPLAAVAFVAILLWGEFNKRKGPPAATA